MEEGRLTPFMVFYTEHRDTISRSKFKRPEDISKEVFRLWHTLGPERKRDYCLLSNLYAESLAKHGEGSGGGKKRKLAAGHRGRRKKDPRLPKPPVSSFMWFSRHHRAILRNEHQELSFCDIGKTVGALWKTATLVEKQPFEEMAAQDKARYTRELAEYKAWRLSMQVPNDPLTGQQQQGQQLQPQQGQQLQPQQGQQLQPQQGQPPSQQPPQQLDQPQKQEQLQQKPQECPQSQEQPQLLPQQQQQQQQEQQQQQQQQQQTLPDNAAALQCGKDAATEPAPAVPKSEHIPAVNETVVDPKAATDAHAHDKAEDIVVTSQSAPH